MSVDCEDTEVASKRKIEATGITHSSSEIDTRNIARVDHLQLRFGSCICVDLVADFPREFKELGHKIRDTPMLQLSNS